MQSGGKVQDSVARLLGAPPYAAKRKDLVLVLRAAYAAIATGARLSLATIVLAPITVVAHRDKANIFDCPSILFRPQAPAMPVLVVEPAGTAPASDPAIICAFISIALTSTGYIACINMECKRD